MPAPGRVRGAPEFGAARAALELAAVLAGRAQPGRPFGGGGLRDERREGGFAHQGFGDGAEDDALEAALIVRADDQEVGAEVDAELKDGTAGRALEHVPSDLSAEPVGGPPRVRLDVALGLFDDRERAAHAGAGGAQREGPVGGRFDDVDEVEPRAGRAFGGGERRLAHQHRAGVAVEGGQDDLQGANGGQGGGGHRVPSGGSMLARLAAGRQHRGG